MVEYKNCIKCGDTLPNTLTFFTKRGGENYLMTECKQCTYQLDKQRKLLKKIHGSPPYNYACPICSRSSDKVEGEGGRNHGKTSGWVIDHDHETGEFRGWLCHKCNRGLGAFKDETKLLMEAIRYLSGFKE